MKSALAENYQWFYRTFADHFTRSIEMMTGEAPLIESSPVEGEPSVAGFALFESPLTLAGGAAVLVAAPEASWKKLGERILAIAGLNDQEDGELQNTFKEAVDQAISGVASGAGARLGREVTSSTSKAVSELKGPVLWANIEVILGEDASVSLLCGATEGLLAGLSPPEKAAPAAPPEQAPAAQAASQNAVAASSGPAPQTSKTVELILDVELPICISFGRAQLPLKDVLKLNTGSIIELNRTVTEPVEIIVNGSVIARGEVVVIEGNFGVRIQSVISRKERIRTLY